MQTREEGNRRSGMTNSEVGHPKTKNTPAERVLFLFGRRLAFLCVCVCRWVGWGGAWQVGKSGLEVLERQPGLVQEEAIIVQPFREDPVQSLLQVGWVSRGPSSVGQLGGGFQIYLPFLMRLSGQ